MGLLDNTYVLGRGANAGGDIALASWAAALVLVTTHRVIKRTVDAFGDAQMTYDCGLWGGSRSEALATIVLQIDKKQL